MTPEQWIQLVGQTGGLGLFAFMVWQQTKQQTAAVVLLAELLAKHTGKTDERDRDLQRTLHDLRATLRHLLVAVGRSELVNEDRKVYLQGIADAVDIPAAG